MVLIIGRVQLTKARCRAKSSGAFRNEARVPKITWAVGSMVIIIGRVQLTKAGCQAMSSDVIRNAARVLSSTNHRYSRIETLAKLKAIMIWWRDSIYPTNSNSRLICVRDA